MMDPERWRRIEELYQSAVDSDAAERATFLGNVPSHRAIVAAWKYRELAPSAD